MQPIDEYTLAAFLAGTLAEDRREEVARYLAKNADARELLQMAFEALEASGQTEEPVAVPVTSPASAQLPRKPTRRARRRASSRTPASGHTAAGSFRSAVAARLPRYAAAAVVVFSVGLGLRLAFGPPSDALRSQRAGEPHQMAVEVSPANLSFQWTEIPEAYHYRLVIYDVQDARVVDRYETAALGTDRDTAFVERLRPKLEAGRTYTFRVDAIDAQNRLVRSSEAVEFRLEP